MMHQSKGAGQVHNQETKYYICLPTLVNSLELFQLMIFRIASNFGPQLLINTSLLKQPWVTQ
jgi:hypothetical protein